ncbi:MAG: pyruvate dehydrogenase [Actinobacteria bacterium]|nr:pyruvate dehydrogenase [Actinomycetota bacterium]
MRKIDVLPDFTAKTLEFNPIPCFAYRRNLKDELNADMTTDESVFLLKVMHYIRAFEYMIIGLRNGEIVPYPDYRFVGTTHLSVGQEAIAAGACSVLQPADYITSTHRGHGHGIAKTAYALKMFSNRQLEKFCQDISFVSRKETPFERAMEVHMYKTMAEFMGREEGYCRGKGGGMHIADFDTGHLGANAIVGGSMAIATGAGMSMMLQDKDSVVVCFHGDGAANNGIWAESLNFACNEQFKEKGVRVIYVIENNNYAISGQCRGELTGIDYLARRGAAYSMDNMHAEVINGMDVLAVRDALKRSVEKQKKCSGPILLEMITYRFLGHMLGDLELYRSREEVEQWKKHDPITNLENQLIELGTITKEHARQINEQIYAELKEITVKAANSPEPKPQSLMEGLFSDTDSNDIDESFKTVNFESSLMNDRRDKKTGKIMYRHAVREALIEEMVRDRRVVFYGEDVAEHGGAFAVTPDVYEMFGKNRVFNTPISEAAIAGTALGMALTGLRPVAELMYIDFLLQSMDQIGNQAAKNKYMFGGKAKVPWTIRTTTGGGRGYAGQHSQALEAIVAHIPGLKIVAPATPADAKGLLKSAIRDDNPVIVIEHILLYADKAEVPGDDYLVPIGKANITRQGNDITIISYSYMAKIALQAAHALESQGIDAEVIDLRSLVPMDTEAVVSSVKKTGRAVVLIQASKCCSFAEHIAGEIIENAFDYLDAPIGFVTAPAVPPPMSPALEYEYMPNADDVCKEVGRIINSV